MLPDALFELPFGEVHMYGIMVGIGIICAFLVLEFYSKYKKINEKLVDFVFYNGIVSIAIGFLIAALFQAVYNYIENPSAGFRFGGGITFIGGFIGGALFFLAIYFLLRKKLKINLLEILSVIPCMILVGHAFGRIGCFFAGCCHGKATDSIFGVQFKYLSYRAYPTQIYESIFLFILFGVCSYLYLKKDFRHNMSLYLVGYGIFRFFIEFLRGDDRGKLLGILSPSQFWSIIMIIVGVGSYFLVEYLWKKKEDKTEIKDGGVKNGENN